jgi:hypothetical protein
MAKSKFDTSFDFGYNVKPKKGKTGKGKKKRQLSPAQQYTARMYMKPRGRR